MTVGRGRVQRVTAGLVDPLRADRGLGRREGHGRVTGAAGRTWPGPADARLFVAGGGHVHGRVVRRPGPPAGPERLGTAGNVERRRGPARHAGLRAAHVQHEHLVARDAPYRADVALGEVKRATVTELLVEDLAACDGQVQEPVAQAGRRAQADHPRDAGPIDGGEGTPDQQVAPDRGQGIHGALGRVRETGHHVAGTGADLGDVGHAGAIDLREVPAYVGVRAVAAAERDGIDRIRTIVVGRGAAYHRGSPRRDRVGASCAEADHVGAGVAGAAALDRAKAAHRVHGAAALDDLADLLGGTGRGRQVRCATGGCRRDDSRRRRLASGSCLGGRDAERQQACSGGYGEKEFAHKAPLVCWASIRPISQRNRSCPFSPVPRRGPLVGSAGDGGVTEMHHPVAVGLGARPG